MAVIVLLTIVTCPSPLQPVGKPTLLHVWYYGWITAVSTGLGVLPLVFMPNLDSYWVGISNAVAAGMMIAASYSLFTEGCVVEELEHLSDLYYSTHIRTIFGAILGLIFIVATKTFLDTHDDIHVGSLGGADARRALLVFLVMTLHSFSEGVGIGVSFGSGRGSELGVFISASLAVHNVPEGLAIAVTLLPQKVCKLTASLFAILSSVPQPLMAVPAYMFVQFFIPFLPVGLGFAGGAMAYVALCELLMEAYEDTDFMTTAIVSSVSLMGMIVLQDAIDEGARS
jgi:zinc transporter ZupT